MLVILLGAQFVKCSTLLQCLQIRASPNMLAIDKDVGDSLLTGHLVQLFLNGLSIFYQSSQGKQVIVMMIKMIIIIINSHLPSVSNSTT